MSFRIDITCTDCGKTAHLRLDSSGANQVFQPASTCMHSTKVDALHLSTRARRCISNVIHSDRATVSDLLNAEYLGQIKNLGPVTFSEIVTALFKEANCSLEEVKQSPLWRTAPQNYTDIENTSWFRLAAANSGSAIG